MKYILIFSLFVVVTFFSTAQVIAQSSNDAVTINYENINPGDDYKYVFKRLREKISLFFSGFNSDSKTEYYQKLVKVRLAELKKVSDNKDIANIQTASQRYETTAGHLTEYVNKKSITKYDQEITDMFNSHILVIKEMQKNYDSTTAEWRFLENDVNSLKQYIEILKK